MVNKKNILGLLVFFIFSCNKDKEIIVEYYSNGLPYKEYSLKRGVIDGAYIEYFTDGKLKTKHIYREGIKIDSSLFYNQKPHYLKQIEYHNKRDTLIIKSYDAKRRQSEKGEIFEKQNKEKWTYYNDEGKIDKILEYVTVNGLKHTNQGWYFDQKGDTIQEFGSYYNYFLNPKKVLVGEVFELIIKYKPLLVINGDVKALVSPNVSSDYSNLDIIALDTINFIENTGYTKISFKDKGRKNLRGFIEELYQITQDSLVKRIMYIDIPIDVD